MKRVIYTKSARRSLARIPSNVARQIIAKIEQYAQDPKSLAQNVVKLPGREGFRLRVGNWRVIFDEDGIVLEVLEVDPRGSVYE